ncbi:MAG TPA: hypothetical protein VG106_13305 [Vicinamibacterales bacterium]|nr:hypothetical protein [Vicinamibacterales bacterium]
MRAATVVKTMTQVGVLGVAVLGCATASHETGRDRTSTLRTPSTSVAGDPMIVPPPGRTSDVLTAVDLSSESRFGTTSLYDALARLRPRFLHPRDVHTGSIASRAAPAVFVNGGHWGGLEALHTIHVTTVVDVKYVRPIDALHRFGPAYGAGVILVRLRR